MKEALKLALEALEDSEDHLAKPYSTDARRAIAAIKAALAQEQCQCPECQIKPHTSDCAVHSKPLTDEEILDAVREADFDWHYGWTLDDEEPNRFTKFARAIEAKLRSKNT